MEVPVKKGITVILPLSFNTRQQAKQWQTGFM